VRRSIHPGVRRLSSGHFAFMRSVVQGLDLRSSWDRYLAVEGEATDLRRVKSTIDWIRSEFAAAARRQAKPGTARLVVLDASRIPDVDGRPSLDEFATSVGMEDFSQAEQLEAYEEAFGSGGDHKGSRRKRLIARQLEALRWLEQMVAQEPGAQDGVGAWFAPAIAERLARAGLSTLALLLTRINAVGQRWWTVVPGIGYLKARRIVEWLRQHESSIGIRVGQHALVPRAEVRPAQLERVVGRATGVVPFEKFLVPAELDGSEGRFRASLHQCLLEAKNDYEAIAAWLKSKHDPNGTGQTATHRAYRKEAERLLLWAILEQRKPLSSLTVEDANAFKWFLFAPPERWCGPRHHQRWSPLWRPLEGPLSAGALRQSMVILRSLFTFLISQNYLIGTPFAAVSLPREAGRSLGSRRALTFGQWDALEERLDEIAADAIGRRRARAIRWLYSTGLRLSEMASAQCGDLQRVDYRTSDGAEDTGWLLDVVGKGNKLRQVPVPSRLVDELQDELESQGLVGDVRHESNKDVSILMRVESGAARPLSSSGLAKGIKAALERCAGTMTDEDAQQLRRASAHWFRHTHGTHALNGRPGQAEAVPVQVVQNNLGHASLGTTSGYLTTERDLRLAAMKRFGERPMSKTRSR
jgi:integrase